MNILVWSPVFAQISRHLFFSKIKVSLSDYATTPAPIHSILKGYNTLTEYALWG